MSTNKKQKMILKAQKDEYIKEMVHRREKCMKMLNEIKDEPDRTGCFTLYYIYVQSGAAQEPPDPTIYKCTSRKRVVTENELYRIVRANLPESSNIKQLGGSEIGHAGHSAINGDTDLTKTLDFIYY